jgi:hypothetical protein
MSKDILQEARTIASVMMSLNIQNIQKGQRRWNKFEELQAMASLKKPLSRYCPTETMTQPISMFEGF